MGACGFEAENGRTHGQWLAERCTCLEDRPVEAFLILDLRV